MTQRPGFTPWIIICCIEDNFAANFTQNTEMFDKISLKQDQQRQIQATNRLVFNGLESSILIQIFQEYHYFPNEGHLELNPITEILGEGRGK